MSRSSLISSCKKDLIDIYTHAIDAVKPDNLIRSAINIKDNRLIVRDRGNDCDINIDIERSKLHLIGGGKCVMSMACGVAQLAKQAGIEHRFSYGHLSLPSGMESTLNKSNTIRDQLNSIDIKCLFGSKDNLPDESSVQASKSILEGVKIACDSDRESSLKPLFIVLVSGGGSACLTSPKFIDLPEKLKLIKLLVQKGINIVELNKVRRYFSNIKGGGLARHILESHPESSVVTLILSDVIGDPIEYIASGPTYLSNASESSASIHKQCMLSILRKYEYTGDLLSLLIDDSLTGDNKPDQPYNQDRICNVVIGNNTIAIDAATRRAQLSGYRVELIGSNLEGSSDLVVERICNLGEQAFRKSGDKVLIIGGGEVTIDKRANETWGKGGRAQEMAIDYMVSRLSARNTKVCPNAIDIFMAGGTDGQDGPTDVAACVASLAELEACNDDEEIPSLEMFLKAKIGHDSYNFWTKHKPDWLVKTGLTGTNVMDLYMYLLRN